MRRQATVRNSSQHNENGGYLEQKTLTMFCMRKHIHRLAIGNVKAPSPIAHKHTRDTEIKGDRGEVMWWGNV